MIAKGQNLEELKAKILRRFAQAAAYRAPLDEKMIAWYKMYRCALEERAKVPEWRKASIHVPEIWSHVETVVPRLAASVLASRPFVAALPRAAEFERQAQIMEALLDYQLSERLHIRNHMGRWARDVVVYGYGPAKTGWKHERRKTRVREPDTSNTFLQQALAIFGVTLKWKTVEREVAVYDDPWLDFIDVFDFYWDPQALDVDPARYVIQRSRVPLDYLKQMEELGVFENVAKVPPLPRAGDDDRRAERLEGLGLSDVDADPEEPLVELLEYWEDNLVGVLANGEVIIRAEPNPYHHGRKPFVVARVIPSSVSLAGVSLIEAAEACQLELDASRNLRMDNAMLLVNKAWTVLDTANIDPKALVLSPGGFVRVPMHDDLKEIPMTDIRQSAYVEEQLLKEDIQKATGAYDTMRGAPAPRRATATEISGRLEQGTLRFQDMRSNMENSGLLRVAELMGALNQQYISQERAVRIVGREGIQWLPVKPQDIMGQFDYMYLGSATEPIANRDLRRQQMIQLYQTVAADPYLRREELLRALLNLFDVKSPERFLRTPQEVQALGILGGSPLGGEAATTPRATAPR